MADIRDLSETLDALSQLVDGSGAGPVVARAVRERWVTRALATADAEPRGEDLAILSLAAELLATVAVQRQRSDTIGQLLEQVRQMTGLGRLALGREVFRAPQLQELPADVALEPLLTLLQTFANASATSLWSLSPADELEHIGGAGELDGADRQLQDAARTLLEEGMLPSNRHAIGIAFKRWRGQRAVLIAHDASPQASLLLEAAAPVLATILERRSRLSDEQPSPQAVFTAVQRRLDRLRFDLHDGPQQDVHLLAIDLALFREQLLSVIAQDSNAHRVVGRLDDLAAQLVALDGDLRRLSAYVQSPFLHTGSLAEALGEITDAFTARTRIKPRISLSGELSDLSESQQLTLLALTREGLSNIREHSHARNVAIDISCDGAGVRAELIDDGRGFDPETTLVRAARDGHLGLVGMHERVRMLGGQTHIESRPGGPTVISVSLPRWPESQ